MSFGYRRYNFFIKLSDNSTINLEKILSGMHNDLRLRANFSISSTCEKAGVTSRDYRITVLTSPLYIDDVNPMVDWIKQQLPEVENIFVVSAYQAPRITTPRSDMTDLHAGN